jgi:hypothetical protein
MGKPFFYPHQPNTDMLSPYRLETHKHLQDHNVHSGSGCVKSAKSGLI